MKIALLILCSGLALLGLASIENFISMDLETHSIGTFVAGGVLSLLGGIGYMCMKDEDDRRKHKESMVILEKDH